MASCRWVLASGEACGKPVTYNMVDDGGEPGAAKVRKYKTFCPEHQARVDIQVPDDEECDLDD